MSNALCIVSCGKEKIWNRYPNLGPVPAEKAYTGTFTRLLIEYAKKFHSNSWVILSAKYGFLHPWELIENYDITFNELKITDELIQKLRKQAELKGLLKYNKVLVLGGRKYCEVCEKVFFDKQVYTPLKGLGLFKAIQLIKNAIECDKPIILID